MRQGRCDVPRSAAQWDWLIPKTPFSAMCTAGRPLQSGDKCAQSKLRPWVMMDHMVPSSCSQANGRLALSAPAAQAGPGPGGQGCYCSLKYFPS